MVRVIDNTPEIRITNLDALPAGTGCRFLLVIDSPYANEYAAKRWLRKLPATIQRTESVIRFK